MQRLETVFSRRISKFIVAMLERFNAKSSDEITFCLYAKSTTFICAELRLAQCSITFSKKPLAAKGALPSLTSKLSLGISPI
jgi:hypothetical protein